MNESHHPLPSTWQIERVEVPAAEVIADLEAAVADALARPLASLPLIDLCGRGSKVTLVISDPSRRSPDHVIVPFLLRQLSEAGVSDDDVTLLIANVGRSAWRVADLEHLLGAGVATRYRIVLHDPSDRAALNELGNVGGVPVAIHHLASEADLLIATGAVEPDPYAGYSGGPKPVALGCAGEHTIRDLLGIRYLDDARVRAGNVEANPFQRDLREIARRAGLLFIVNAVRSSAGVVAVKSGAPSAVHDALIDIARDLHEALVRRSDYNVLLVADGDRPESLFEASAEIADLGAAQDTVLARHAVVIVPVDCEGEDTREASRRGNFYDALRDGGGAQAVLQRLRNRGLRDGEHRAYRLARAMSEGDLQIIVVGGGCGARARESGLLAAASLEDATRLAESLQFGDTMRALIVPPTMRILRPMFGAGARVEADDGAAAQGPDSGRRSRYAPPYYDIQPITEFKRAKT